MMAVSNPTQEPQVTINGHMLTPAQVKAIDIALTTADRVSEARLQLEGADSEMLSSLRSRIDEIRTLFTVGQAGTDAPSPVLPAGQETVRMKFEIPKDRQEAFVRMWREFVTGTIPQGPMIRSRAADREQGLVSLRELVAVAQRDDDQSRRIAFFPGRPLQRVAIPV